MDVPLRNTAATVPGLPAVGECQGYTHVVEISPVTAEHIEEDMRPSAPSAEKSLRSTR